MTDFDLCTPCRDGAHENCTEGACCCIEAHNQDDPTMRGFKRLKRLMDTDRPVETDTLAKLPIEMRMAILRHRQGH